MKTLLAAILAIMAFSNPVLAKKTADRSNDSVCLAATRNVISEMERGTIMSGQFELLTIDQQIDGASHTITLESRRAQKELGKKLYIVDVGVHAVGASSELMCEVTALRSYLEQ